MSLLVELLTLTEERDADVVELVSYLSPARAKAAIDKLWATHRLTYQGARFFTKAGADGDSDVGSIWGELEEAVREWADSNDHLFTASIFTDLGEIDAAVELDREVYLGIDPKTKNLLAGWEVEWENFNRIEDELEELIQQDQKQRSNDYGHEEEEEEEEDDDAYQGMREDLQNEQPGCFLFTLKPAGDGTFSVIKAKHSNLDFYEAGGLKDATEKMGIVDIRNS